jgi:SRSO17 transposase
LSYVTFVDPDDNGAALDELLERVAERFTRAEPRRRAGQYIRGVLSGLARPNGWTLAEYAGEHHPNGMQRLLTTARWDVDGVRDDVRAWVGERIGERAGGVLVPTEVGFRKKGTSSVGVHRQYDGAARRLENVQLGVFLSYLSGRGWGLVDRELYLPQDWLADREQARRLGVPEGVRFADRAELALNMVGRALDSGLPVSWVAADEPGSGYGRLRAWLDKHGVCYVVAAAWYDPVRTAQRQPARVRDLGRAVPDPAWQPYRSGSGTTRYEWARVPLAGPVPEAPGIEHVLLVRRDPGGHDTPRRDPGGRDPGGRDPGGRDAAAREPDEPIRLGYYHCRLPAGTPTAVLARVAGAPDEVRERVERARGELGLDRYQVRRYEAWYRHVTLCLAAGAYLAAVRARTR